MYDGDDRSDINCTYDDEDARLRDDHCRACHFSETYIELEWTININAHPTNFTVLIFRCNLVEPYSSPPKTTLSLSFSLSLSFPALLPLPLPLSESLFSSLIMALSCKDQAESFVSA